MTVNAHPKQRTVRLKGKAYTKFRLEVAIHAIYTCDDCFCYAPELDINGKFDKFTCGHVAHIKSRGSGGGDTLDNVKWKCWDCHTKEHGPRWSKGG